MTESAFPSNDQSALLVIDVQERLLRVMNRERTEELLKAHRALIEMAALFDIPVVVTEQYPKGLGPTVAPVLDALEGNAERGQVPARIFEKTEFSACRNEGFRAEVVAGLPRDVIVTGMETHVCVLQTALGLLESGRRVFVPHDAVCSRTTRNYENGLALIERAGGIITNTETLIFARLGKAGGDAFKRLSRLVK